LEDLKQPIRLGVPINRPPLNILVNLHAHETISASIR
jgi:hypothetical protein